MTSLAQRRIALVEEHMRLETVHDWDGVIATFDHPRYDINNGAQVYDGEEAVRRYFEESRIAFPDQGNELISIAHDDANDMVLVEIWLTGTHDGPLKIGDRIIEPTGKSFRVRMMGAFEFAPGGEKIVCERPYIDPMSVLRDLGLI